MLKANQHGRSMIEMLGVLAIVGILSVGAISGTSNAFYYYKVIKEMEKYNLFICGFMEHETAILKSAQPSGFTFYVDDVDKLGIIPTGWKKKGNSLIYDTLGSYFNFYSGASKEIVLGYFLNQTTKQKTDTLKCTMMWQHVIIPNQEWIGNVWVNGSGGKGGNFYGTHVCNGKNKKCISDISLAEMQNFCQSCAEETVCNIIITFQ